MFGSDAFGSVPFAASDLPVFDVIAMLASSRDRLVYTVEIEAWNLATSSVETLRFGSRDWATAPTDLPPSTPFDGRLISPLQYSRSIVSSDIDGLITARGSLTFSNADGVYDAIVNTHAVDRRAVTVRLGRVGDAFMDHVVIFRGVGIDWFADEDVVTLELGDRSYLLDIPVQPDIFAGTGGAEGGDDLTGKRRPRVYGWPVGASPVLVDAALLIYQVSDLPCSVLGVYDRGVPLAVGSNHASYAALAAATVPGGEVHTCEAEGFIRLGATPAGVVFCTAVSSDAELHLLNDVLRHLVIDAGVGLSPADVDDLSLEIMEITAPLPIDYFLGPDDSTTIAELIHNLMPSLGGWAGFRRDGRFTAAALSEARWFGTPKRIFFHREGDVISLNREQLPSGLWPPPWRVRVAWGRAWTVFTDFADVVGDAERSFYAQPYRVAIASDPTVLTDHPTAQDPPIVEGYAREQTPAQLQANHRLVNHTIGKWFWRFKVPRIALDLEIGDLVGIAHPRFGLDQVGDGYTPAILVSIDDRIDLGDGSGVEEVELLAWG